MRIIIAPAKQMVDNNENIAPAGLPIFQSETETLMAFMKGLSFEEARKLWGCNDKLAEENFQRFASMNLNQRLTPAILAYDGIAYKYMAPNVFENGEFDYVQEHLRILSGFYGVVKPMDGVTPYRLEMQAKAKVAGTKNLYEFWGDKLYHEVMDGDHVLVNLASKEYSKCIEKYLTPEDTFITCIFGEIDKGRIVQKGVYAKMARGEMVRYMAETGAQKPEEIKGFDRLGYRYSEADSNETTYVFLKERIEGEQ